MHTTRVPPRATVEPSAPVRTHSEPEQHSLLRSVLLHLAPGLLSLVFYIAVAPVVQAWGFPPLFAGILTIPLVIVPFMLGWLALEARRVMGSHAPLALVQYRERVPVRRLAGWSAALIVWGAIVFGAAEAAGVTDALRGAFSALPSWFLHPAEFDEIVAMATPQLVIFLASMVLVVGVLAPTVEELYFRGYLMPALGRFGAWAPVAGVALFTLYHFESPWEGPVRFAVVLPMAWAVWKLRSVRLGIVVHVALNTMSAVALTLAVLSAR
jgi:uncharacterized protein